MKNLTESSTFTANVSVPEDNVDFRTAASVETGFQALANRTKHLNDNKAAGAPASTDNGIPRFDGTGGKTLQDSGIRITDGALLEYITPPSRTVLIPLSAGYATSGTTNGSQFANFTDNFGQLIVQLRLPQGAIVTQVRAKVDPGAARATSTDRIRLLVQRFLPDVSGTSTPSPSTIADQRDDGTGNVQTITASGLSETIDNGTTVYSVGITAGNDAATNNDRLYGIEVTYTDPGPRNH